MSSNFFRTGNFWIVIKQSIYLVLAYMIIIHITDKGVRLSERGSEPQNTRSVRKSPCGPLVASPPSLSPSFTQPHSWAGKKEVNLCSRPGLLNLTQFQMSTFSDIPKFFPWFRIPSYVFWKVTSVVCLLLMQLFTASGGFIKSRWVPVADIASAQLGCDWLTISVSCCQY